MLAGIVDPSSQSITVREVADPLPGPGELLVRVRAAGLNRADLGALAGTYRPGKDPGATPPAPFIGGLEMAGEIEKVGAGVERWRAGDRVMGQAAGFAELAVLDSGCALPVPGALSWEEAGAMPIALLTSHDALVTNGRLVPGSAVLVHAATSGVGMTAVRIAGHLGASVVLATSRSGVKLRVVEEAISTMKCPLVTIDTSEEDFVAAIDKSTGGAGVDIIVDTIGASVLAGNIAAAGIGGRIVQVGRLGGRRTDVDLDDIARKRLILVGTTFRTRTIDDKRAVVLRCLEDLGPELSSFRPRVDRRFALTNLVTGLDALRADAHIGKIVVVP